MQGAKGAGSALAICVAIDPCALDFYLGFTVRRAWDPASAGQGAKEFRTCCNSGCVSGGNPGWHKCVGRVCPCMQGVKATMTVPLAALPPLEIELSFKSLAYSNQVRA